MFKKSINELKEQLSSVEEGELLVRLAEARNIPITFDSSLPCRGAYGCMFEVDTTSNQIKAVTHDHQVLINPVSFRIMNYTKNLVIDMAHELRHVWQDKTLSYHESMWFLQPEEYIILNRILEGDARAHTKLVVDKIYPGFLRKIFSKQSSAHGQLQQTFNSYQNSFAARGSYDSSDIFFLKKTLIPKTKANSNVLSHRITDVFNKESLQSILSAGREDGFSYMNAKTPEDLIEKIRDLLPHKTRQQCAELTKVLQR